MLRKEGDIHSKRRFKINLSVFIEGDLSYGRCVRWEKIVVHGNDMYGFPFFAKPLSNSQRACCLA